MAKAKKKRGRGRPSELNARFAATLACDLQLIAKVRARIAAVAAWQTLHELSPKTFPDALPPDAIWHDLMRHIKSGRRPRIEYSPWVFCQALLRLPTH